MRVIVSGYNGTMGKVLIDLMEEYKESIQVVAGISREKTKTETFTEYTDFDDIEEEADIIIDFSHHSITESLTKYAEKTKTNVIIATTGHSEKEKNYINQLSKHVAVVYSGNYSLGVNAILQCIKEVSRILSDYDIEIIEKHHNKKIDSPSGTAKMFFNAIKKSSSLDSVYGREGESKRKDNEVGVHSVRAGTIIGEHEIIFAGEDEIIEIKHTALSKKIFAKGAVKAALWLKNKKSGLYSMSDVLNLY